ncbi:divergent polysaccharide deacetylase family protein [Acidiphilium sp. JA12-A1]|uniref:divergent polysaccharide deacetylase family protein n=1 Tax=Acidiphilium sp. JA12-A1 TaxID=1464546 RepID=UPI000460D228|nr:divergent polysaccharide deacetylase family protein [Acidiphilium sp. JA12-A1]KDM67672.1 hypothetical protein ACIDI_30c00510 [Acidiphilium sp. JA12-A1]
MPPFRIARSVKLFWAGVAAAALIGAVVLQVIGPPDHDTAMLTGPVLHRSGSAIPPPNPALLVASKANPAWKIPHPAPDGMTPMRYYAAAAPVPVPQGLHPVAVMMGGIGEARQASRDAIRSLPPAVSLALTPYGPHLRSVVAAARAAGHETLMGIPMQTDREPAVTEGDEALRGSELDPVNLKHLDWALSRSAGYVGVTDEIGMSVDETYLTQLLNRHWLGKQLRPTGLLLVTASQGSGVPSGVPGRVADVVIHPEMSVDEQRAALKRLAATAVASGSALGVISSPTADDIAVLAQWCQGLKADGLVLVPVSALVAARGAQ